MTLSKREKTENWRKEKNLKEELESGTGILNPSRPGLLKTIVQSLIKLKKSRGQSVPRRQKAEKDRKAIKHVKLG